MIVVVGGIKGGSGKTTIATNLTVLRSASGKKVLLVDADEQRSASDWAHERENSGIETKWSTIQLCGDAVYPQLKRMSLDYDDIIVDVGGRDTISQRSALKIADVLLVPFKPRSLDIWTIGSLKKLLSEMKVSNDKLLAYAIINQADSCGTDNKDSQEIISDCPSLKCITIPIGHRKAFANAATEGLGISELKIQDKKALQELLFLYNSIYDSNVG